MDCSDRQHPQPVPKPWGTTTRLLFDENIQVEKIVAHAGGYSSPHLHRHKWNQFWLISGCLLIRCFSRPVVGSGLVHSFELILDQSRRTIFIPAEMIHQFEALEDSVAYEVYGAEPGHVLDPNEITRFGENGRRAVK